MGSHREDHKEEETLAALQWFDSAKVRTNNDTKETSNSKKISYTVFTFACTVYIFPPLWYICNGECTEGKS
jgi:hypothetical protein